MDNAKWIWMEAGEFRAIRSNSKLLFGGKPVRLWPERSLNESTRYRGTRQDVRGLYAVREDIVLCYGVYINKRAVCREDRYLVFL